MVMAGTKQFKSSLEQFNSQDAAFTILRVMHIYKLGLIIESNLSVESRPRHHTSATVPTSSNGRTNGQTNGKSLASRESRELSF